MLQQQHHCRARFHQQHRVPFASDSTLRTSNRSYLRTKSPSACKAAASPHLDLTTTGQHPASSSTASVPAAVAAAAAAVALLLAPVQSAQALPEAQLQAIKQTIDQDFQQGQVRGSKAARIVSVLVSCSNTAVVG